MVVDLFSIEKDFSFAMSEGLKAEIETHETLLSERYQEWRLSDLDMIHRYQMNEAVFKV